LQNVTVSIVIPTRNSSETLPYCLTSIKKQTYKNIEIIVVDNFSEDDTLGIARRFTNLVFTMPPERSTQVNYGVSKASGKYVYRVDSDFVLDRNVVMEAVKLAESKGYGAVLIHNTSDPSVSYWSRVRKFERDMYDTNNSNVAVRFIRRDIFNSLGGFDPRLSYGEDYDLHNRIIKKYPIGKVNAKEIHLGEYRTLLEIAKKNYYYGKFVQKFLKKNRIQGLNQVNPFRIAYFKHLDQFIKNPSLTIGFITYQTVRYFSGVLGFLVSLIKDQSK
jgi:glycosyltransferase involved in cell wall biosynthesis